MKREISTDPVEWSDLDERDQINLCCDVIAKDEDYLSDAFIEIMSDLTLARCLAHLRLLNDAGLGRLVREHVVQVCRREAERRLEIGQYSWERLP